MQDSYAFSLFHVGQGLCEVVLLGPIELAIRVIGPHVDIDDDIRALHPKSSDEEISMLFVSRVQT